MKTFEKLESLGFFDWLSETHNLRDTDMKPEYLDELPLNDIHRTVVNSMVFRWFREKYNIYAIILPSYADDKVIKNRFFYEIADGNKLKQELNYHSAYEEAELSCLKKLIEIVESKSE